VSAAVLCAKMQKVAHERDRLRQLNAELVAALETILAGSDHTGRWLDPDGSECDEGDPGARWEEFDLLEQQAWLESVADTARVVLAKVKREPS
jgi:hypothetical protein